MPDFAGVDAGVATGAVTVGEGVLAVSGDVAEAAAGWLTVSSGVGVAEAFAACLRARTDERAGRAGSAVVGSLSDDVVTLAFDGGAGAEGATTVSGVVVTGVAGAAGSRRSVPHYASSLPCSSSSRTSLSNFSPGTKFAGQVSIGC